MFLVLLLFAVVDSNPKVDYAKINYNGGFRDRHFESAD